MSLKRRSRHGTNKPDGRKAHRLLRLSSLAAVAVLAAGSAVAVAGAAPAQAAPPSGSQTFSFNDATQYFMVPAGVTQLQVTAWGGSGGDGSGSGSSEYDAPGGLGAEISESVTVSPGDTLVVEVGGQGGAADGQIAGAGGLSSGSGQNGGPAGNVNSSLDGDAGGGGGGGTEVVDHTAGDTVLVDAAGGGGGGGGGTITGSNGGAGANAGGAGSSANTGVGEFGSGDNGGPGGLYGASGSPAGLSGTGEAVLSGAGTGGGGGGGSEGGSGGADGGTGAGGGGGGGAGSSAYPSTIATDVVVSNAVPGNGGVTISWPSLAQLFPNTKSFGFSSQDQSFTVPAGVTELQVTAWGGSGGNGQLFFPDGDYQAPGGLGAEISENVLVTPGQVLDVDVGGQGGVGTSDSAGGYGGTGGIWVGQVLFGQGFPQNGGPGGNVNDTTPGATDGAAGGGGGAATEVTGASGVLTDAGGGGGGGGSGIGIFNQAGYNGGAGGDAGSEGSGYVGSGFGGGGGGQFAGAGPGSGEGTSGSGEQVGTGAGTGGGGGGGSAGGAGGSAGGVGGGGGGGGGGAGSSVYSSSAILSNAVPGDGGVMISWPAVASVSLSAGPNPALVGDTVTLTATATGTGPAPTGTVTFLDLTTGFAIGLPASLNGGTATITTTGLPVGDTQVVAHYFGDSTYASANSSVLTEDVLPLSWSAGPSGPTARSAPAMANDPNNGETVLFGGGGMGNSLLSDTWVLPSPSGTWKELTANGPSGRTGAGLVWDSALSEFVLFGGVDNDGFFSDTWAFDPATNTWARLSPTGMPTARAGAAMAALPDGDIVLFGGLSYTGYLGDTWVYDPGANTWAEEHPAKSPSGLYYPSAAVDPSTGTMLLFGGLGTTGYDGGTWSYTVSGDTWAELSPSGTAPPALDGAGLGFDTQTGDFVLVDGETAKAYSNATYAYDPATSAWATLAPTTSPPPRAAPGFVYDEPANTFVQFGGWNGTNFLSDTWELPG